MVQVMSKWWTALTWTNVVPVHWQRQASIKPKTVIQKHDNVILWYFWPYAVEQIIDLPVIWDTMTLTWRQCNDMNTPINDSVSKLKQNRLHLSLTKLYVLTTFDICSPSQVSSIPYLSIEESRAVWLSPRAIPPHKLYTKTPREAGSLP